MAKQFYEEVIGVCKSKPKLESEQNLPHGSAIPVKSVPSKVQLVKTMNGTNSSANQSDYQSVITLKEQLQAQSKQHRQLQAWQLSQKLKGFQQPRQYFASRQSTEAQTQEKLQTNVAPPIKLESTVDQHKSKPLFKFLLVIYVE